MTISKYLLGGLLTTTLLIGCSPSAVAPSAESRYPLATQYVDPLIGTDWVGNVYPGASVPHGMVQLSPDNGLPGWDRIAGYYYPDSTIAGFSHTHLSGTGAGDLYDVSFLPMTTPYLESPAPLGLHARFDHAEEHAHAGYYSVVLRPYNILVELTAGEHVGVQRYTFREASDSAVIVLNLAKAMNWDRTESTSLEVRGDSILGHRHSSGWAREQALYFCSKLSKAPDSVRIEEITSLEQSEDSSRLGHIAYLYYRVVAGEQITIRTALSTTGLGTADPTAEMPSGAVHNLKASLQAIDSLGESAEGLDEFDRYRLVAERSWESELSKVQIEGASPEQMRVFYTALYRARLCPTLLSDASGAYRSPRGQIISNPGDAPQYSTYSLWDTYRSAHPLYSILGGGAELATPLLWFASEAEGILPVWTLWTGETDMMIGHHSIPVLVEIALKDPTYYRDPALRDKITQYLKATTERKDYRGMDDYRRLGYVPADKWAESVSLTLEYAYDDACVAVWAEHIGDQAMATEYRRRAQGYRKLWDAESGFFRPRLSDGSWLTPFDPYAYTEHYTESNAYQYQQSVQHDIAGLIELAGGAEAFARVLDRLFSSDTPEHITLPIFSTGMIGQYAHGNEPVHHVAFLYNKVGQPWRTAELTRRICTELYTDRPDGVCGNEDCGQMSAWYVFASLGFYPVDPVSGQYELTTPLYKRSTLRVSSHTTGEATFTIDAQGLSDTHRYIERVEVDGAPWRHSYITHEQIMRGSKITLYMTDQRGVKWYD